jgi:hypothetical protein
MGHKFRKDTMDLFVSVPWYPGTLLNNLRSWRQDSFEGLTGTEGYTLNLAHWCCWSAVLDTDRRPQIFSTRASQWGCLSIFMGYYLASPIINNLKDQSKSFHALYYLKSSYVSFLNVPLITQALFLCERGGHQIMNSRKYGGCHSSSYGVLV